MYKSCCFIVICSLSGFQAHAESIKESFAGETKVFLNIYGFAADIDGAIGYQGLNYQLDQPFKDTVDALDQALMGHLEIK